MLAQVIEENGVPVIKLAGTFLQSLGFNIDDIVKVSLSDNEIIIRKSPDTAKLQAMQNKNPSLKKLCEMFNLDLLTE